MRVFTVMTIYCFIFHVSLVTEKLITVFSFFIESAIYTFHSGMEALNQLSAEVGHAYECTTTSTGFKLTANHSDVNVTLTKIEFQPFEVKDGHPGKGKNRLLFFFN